MSLEPSLAKLLEAWQDGGLSEPEYASLLHHLDCDADLRHRFAEQVAMLGATRAAAEQDPRWLVLFDLLEHGENGGCTEILSFENATMKRIAPPVSRRWYQSSGLLAVAAAVALLPVGAFLLKISTQDDTKETVVIPADPRISAVAVILGASSDEGQMIGTYLKPGPISRSGGWLTIQTLNGVSVTLDAPFHAELLSHDRIRVNKGRARVRVPEGAEGFRLESPAFDVVDLGTEFAAIVNSDGTGTCRVFEGAADVSLLDSLGEVKQTKRLNASESVGVNPSQQSLMIIEEADEDYPEMKQPPRSTLALPHIYPAEVMAMGPAGYWRFEEIRNGEIANEVPDGPPLTAKGTAAISKESGNNHSGALMNLKEWECFQLSNRTGQMLTGDFSIGMFVNFEWLQNFVLWSAMRYDQTIKGHSLILQSYASFRRTGYNGTGLHAVLRDPPAWDGGTEVYGNIQLRPQHWYHIAAIRNGDLLTLYLDGSIVGSEVVGSMPVNCREIFVGRLNGSATQSRKEARGLVGHIDELAIFPRALSDGEIRSLAMRGQNP